MNRAQNEIRNQEHKFSMMLVCDSREEAESLKNEFPKYARVFLSAHSYQENPAVFSFTTKPTVSVHIDFRANELTGAVNESGLKRRAAVINVLQRLELLTK
jgi:hypothetical protein